MMAQGRRYSLASREVEKETRAPAEKIPRPSCSGVRCSYTNHQRVESLSKWIPGPTVFGCSNGGSTTKNRSRLMPEDSIRRAICRYNEGLSKGNYGLVSMSRWDTILGPAAPVRMIRFPAMTDALRSGR